MQEFITREGFRMLFLPAMSCALSPIEHFWSTVKGSWAKQMSKLTTDYDQETLLNEVSAVVARCQQRMTVRLMNSSDAATEKVRQGYLV